MTWSACKPSPSVRLDVQPDERVLFAAQRADDALILTPEALEAPDTLPFPDDEEGPIHAAVFSWKDLEARLPGLLNGPVRVEAAFVDEVQRSPDGTRMLSPLPEGTRYYELSPDNSAVTKGDFLRRKLSLSLAFDAEHCRSYDALEPFGPRLRLEKPRASWLPDGDVILRDFGKIYRLNASGDVLASLDAPPNRWFFDAKPMAESIVALEGPSCPVDAAECVLVDSDLLTLKQDLSAIVTSTRTIDFANELVVDEDKIYVFALNGHVWRFEAGWVSFPSITLPTSVADPEIRDAVATHDVDYPLVASSPNAIHTFEARTQTWKTDIPVDGQATNATYLGLGTTHPPSPVVFAGGTGDLLVRGPLAGNLEAIQLELPPRFRECTVDLEKLRTEIVDLATFEDRVFLVVGECDAALEVRTSDLCTAMLGSEDDAVWNGRGFRSVEAGPHGVILAAVDGLYIARKRSP